MKEAIYSDRDVVVKILSSSFKNDPHFNWLIEQSRHKDKVEITLNYVFEETMARGKVYLNDEENAAALWMSEKPEKLSLEFIKRNIDFSIPPLLNSTNCGLNQLLFIQQLLIHEPAPHQSSS